MLEEDKHHGGSHWWSPQATSLPFYPISNEYGIIGAWLLPSNSTHELSSGKLESRVADIASGGVRRKRGEGKVLMIVGKSQEKINFQDFSRIYYLIKGRQHLRG
jgi:hypothetical protein